MSNALSLSPKLRNSPSGQKLLNQLSASRRRTRELKEEAALSMSPMTATVATWTGAAAAGGIAAYMPDRQTSLTSLGALAAIIAGALQDRPELVAFGNGLGAPLVAQKVHEVLTKKRKADAAAADAAKAA